MQKLKLSFCDRRKLGGLLFLLISGFIANYQGYNYFFEQKELEIKRLSSIYATSISNILSEAMPDNVENITSFPDQFRSYFHNQIFTPGSVLYPNLSDKGLNLKELTSNIIGGNFFYSIFINKNLIAGQGKLEQDYFVKRTDLIGDDIESTIYVKLNPDSSYYSALNSVFAFNITIFSIMLWSFNLLLYYFFCVRLNLLNTLKASGDGRPIFVATRSLFIFVVVTLFVSVYDLMDKIIKYRDF